VQDVGSVHEITKTVGCWRFKSRARRVIGRFALRLRGAAGLTQSDGGDTKNALSKGKKIQEEEREGRGRGRMRTIITCRVADTRSIAFCL